MEKRVTFEKLTVCQNPNKPTHVLTQVISRFHAQKGIGIAFLLFVDKKGKPPSHARKHELLRHNVGYDLLEI